MAHKPKKARLSTISQLGFLFGTPDPFTQAGVYDDEIILDFEGKDKKKLYVPKNFLTVASPVFEAMFKHDLKEKAEKAVKMTGKSYDDFLEFLMCIHPRFLKEIGGK